MSPIISFKPRKGIGNMLRLDMKQAEPPPIHPAPHHQPPCSLSSNKLKLSSKEIEVVTANGGDGGFF